MKKKNTNKQWNKAIVCEVNGLDDVFFIKKFKNTLMQYDKAGAFEVFEQYALERGGMGFIDDMIVPTLIAIGEEWERGEAALSQVYMGSKLCEDIVERLLPRQTQESNLQKPYPIGIVTLEDYHNFGKKIVSSILKAAGFRLVDFGYGLSAENVIERVLKEDTKILLISVLMYPSALKVGIITDKLHQLTPPVKVLVGGAPFLMDQQLWKRIGADAMGKNAAEALPILKEWFREAKASE